MKPVPFDYQKAADARAAAGALEQPGAMIIAGGQSLGPMLNLRLARPGMLIDISRVGEFEGQEEQADRAVYGALTTHASFEDGRVVDVTNGMMASVAAGIAFRAVRNKGTIGGSLAHADPAADWVNTVVALGARIITTVREVPAESFMLAPFTTVLDHGELISAVAVPRLSAGARWGYRKFCRKTGEFADAIGAVVLDRDRGVARVVLGAVDGPPILLPAIADALRDGQAVSEATLQGAVDAALPDAEPAARHLHRVMLARAIEDAAP